MNSITFENIHKSYGETTILDNLNLTIEPGERLILLGPSGCGKSTILRIIAGLTEATSGEIYFGDENVTNTEAGERNISMVFQNYALYPHMSVYDNVTYALRAHKVDKWEIAKRASEALEMLGLKGYEKRKPKELSGGQRQRVALARAVVKQSGYFLLDEPLSNLDAQLRHHARKELLKIHERFKQTFIYVTHDQVEAMTLGDRVALLNEGKIQMMDTPENIYNRPANVFTAKFIGSPSCNIAEAVYVNGHLSVGNKVFLLSDEWREVVARDGGSSFVLGLRPEHIALSRVESENSVPVVITSSENYGDQKGFYFQMNEDEWVATSSVYDFAVGETVYFTPAFEKMHIFNGETQESIGYP